MSLTDQFIVDRTFEVDKLEELLDSPDQDESGAYNTLISYKVKAEGKGIGKSDKSGKSPKFEKVKNVTVSNALDSLMEDLLVVKVKKPTRLFVPTTVPGGVDPFLCYDAKLVKDETKHGKVEDFFVEDQFGPHTIDVKKERKLCFIAT